MAFQQYFASHAAELRHTLSCPKCPARRREALSQIVHAVQQGRAWTRGGGGGCKTTDKLGHCKYNASIMGWAISNSSHIPPYTGIWS